MGSVPDEIPTRFLPRLGLFLARFCISAWIGAASLFVVVGVAEITRGGFDSATKDSLVAIRFPAFYLCGATLVTLAWLGCWLAGHSTWFSRRRRMASLILLAIVLALMVADYVWIYLPLLQMVTPPGQAKPDSFRSYHEASKWINLAGLLIGLFVAILVNWPANTNAAVASDPRNQMHE